MLWVVQIKQPKQDVVKVTGTCLLVACITSPTKELPDFYNNLSLHAEGIRL